MYKQVLLVVVFLLVQIQSQTVTQVRFNDKSQCPLSRLCERTAVGEAENLINRCTVFINHMKLSVEIENGNTSQFYGFCVRVDEFALLTIQNAYPFFATNRNSTIRIHAGNFRSPRKFIFNIVNNTEAFNDVRNRPDTMASFYTAIVNFNAGRMASLVPANATGPFGIAWENSCDDTLETPSCTFDPTSGCIRKQDCSVTDDATLPPTGKVLRIYLAFQGTDFAGNPMKSASFTPARYRQYAWAGYFGTLTRTLLPTTN